jgi:iron(III) transport system substrate-binding protein
MRGTRIEWPVFQSKDQFAMLKSSRVFIVLLIPLVGTTGCFSPKNRVVLFCAQDEEFATSVLGDFKKTTHLNVDVKYDTEATKSVSLISELLAHKERPRCDVHWNNEILGTIRLERAGLLEPYTSPSAATYPNYTHPANHAWQAFAARARIIVVNTTLVPETERPKSLLDLALPKWKGKVALAKPQFGTSATQAVCLFEVLGRDKAKDYYRSLRANEVQLVAGNKQVAEGVASGMFVAGVTDTDDAMEEIKDGKPIAIIFPDRESPATSRMGTLFIPNTVALIKGSPNQAGGKKLIDFLLSTGNSHQIPLNPAVHAKLPPQILTPGEAKPMQVDWEKAVDLWDEVQEFLRTEFARPQ